MRQIVISIAITVVSEFGKLSGFFLSFAPRKSRVYFSKWLRKVVEYTDYFLVYKFVDAFIPVLFFRVEEVLFSRKLPGGSIIELNVKKKTQREIFLKRLYEENIVSYVLKNVQEGDVFVDVGANTGYYTLIASQIVGKSGKVLAFEPEKENFRTLSKNVSANRPTNVVLFENALGSKIDTGTIHINQINEGGHSINKVVGINSKTQNIDIVTLDSILESDSHLSKRIAFIKIDVEGFEYEVLKGMRFLSECDTNRLPDIVCEVSQDWKEITDLLYGYGYKSFVLNFDGTTKDTPALVRSNEAMNVLFRVK